MDCKHAYFKDGIQYVLCDCDGATPKTKKLSEVTQYMCAYQRFCPNIRACALLPEYVNCSKLKREATERREVLQPPRKQKPKRKRAES